MTCVYQRHRTKEELEKLLGQAPLPIGEVYLSQDPPRMYKAVQHTKRPCLAFKILRRRPPLGPPRMGRTGLPAGIPVDQARRRRDRGHLRSLYRSARRQRRAHAAVCPTEPLEAKDHRTCTLT